MLVEFDELPLELGTGPPGTARLCRWLAACLMVVFCVLALLVHFRYEQRRDEMAAIALTTAEAAIVALDREIEGEVARLQGLGSSPMLKKPDLREFYDQLQQVQKPPGAWMALLREGAQLINTGLPFETTKFPPGYEYAEGYQRSIRLLAQGRPYVVRPLSWSPLKQQFVTGIAIKVPRASDATYLLWIGIPRQSLASILRDLSTPRNGELRILAAGDGELVTDDGTLQLRSADMVPEELRSLLRAGASTATVLIGGRQMAAGIAHSTRVAWSAAVLLPTDKVATAETHALAGLALASFAAFAIAALVLSRINGYVSRRLVKMRELVRESGLVRRETEDRYRVFWENTGEGLFIARLDFGGGSVLQDCNPAYLRLIAGARPGVAPTVPWAYGDCAAPAGIEDHVKACERGADCVRFDCVMRAGPARLHWEVMLAPVRDPSTGRVVRLRGCVRDVTRSRAAKQALSRLSGKILAAQDQERRRIARELHDSTGQTLLAASLGIARAKAEGTALEPLMEAEALLTQAQTELRTQSYLLHPPLLDELGLVKALEEYIAGFERRSSMRITFEAVAEVRAMEIPSKVGIALFRVAQEALGNAWRHAECTLTQVSLALQEPGWAVLAISDDGRGLTYADNAWPEVTSGVGLASMRERMSQIGGSLTLSQQTSGGTIVQAFFRAGLAGAGKTWPTVEAPVCLRRAGIVGRIPFSPGRLRKGPTRQRIAELREPRRIPARFSRTSARPRDGKRVSTAPLA